MAEEPGRGVTVGVHFGGMLCPPGNCPVRGPPPSDLLICPRTSSVPDSEDSCSPSGVGGRAGGRSHPVASCHPPCHPSPAGPQQHVLSRLLHSVNSNAAGATRGGHSRSSLEGPRALPSVDLRLWGQRSRTPVGLAPLIQGASPLVSGSLPGTPQEGSRCLSRTTGSPGASGRSGVQTPACVFVSVFMWDLQPSCPRSARLGAEDRVSGLLGPEPTLSVPAPLRLCCPSFPEKLASPLGVQASWLEQGGRDVCPSRRAGCRGRARGWRQDCSAGRGPRHSAGRDPCRSRPVPASRAGRLQVHVCVEGADRYVLRYQMAAARRSPVNVCTEKPVPERRMKNATTDGFAFVGAESMLCPFRLACGRRKPVFWRSEGRSAHVGPGPAFASW